MAIEDALEMGVRVRAAVREALFKSRLPAGDSAQGAFDVVLPDCDVGVAILSDAARACGFRPRIDFTLGLDMAASDYFKRGLYTYRWPAFTADSKAQEGRASAVDLMKVYLDLMQRYCVSYVEDGFAETDTEAWAAFMRSAPSGTLVVGDDLFASSAARIREGATLNLANGALIKPNQIGTISETLEAMRAAATNRMTTVVSQRSGENDDSFIAHLALAGRADYLKAGGMSRMDRIIKFNELLRFHAAA